jgi:putative endonuclease
MKFSPTLEKKIDLLKKELGIGCEKSSSKNKSILYSNESYSAIKSTQNDSVLPKNVKTSQQILLTPLPEDATQGAINLFLSTKYALENREYQHIHKTAKAAKYIKDNGNFKLVYKEEYATLLQAMRREKQLKGWTKAKKEALIAGDIDKLKKLSKRRIN